MLYQDINTIIAKNDPEFSAAEAHGIAVGILCVNEATKAEFWLSELVQETGEFDFDDRSDLEDLFEETRALLVSDEFVFIPLLPDEKAHLSEQVVALRFWCQGFLYGFGSSTRSSDWSEDIKELVKDISEFTKLDSDAEGEEAENDFMEVTEYLRAAVIYLRTELNSANNVIAH